MKLKLLVKHRFKFMTFVTAVMMSTLCHSVNGQNLTIKGQVTDGLDPLPGATIRIENSTVGVVADVEGHYSIKANSGDVLVISYIGYLTQSITIGNATTIDVTLESDAKSLEEVVIVGYGSQKKKEVTGAVNNVSASQISKVPTSDLGTALQGQVAGVNVQAANGSPGETANIQIRGVGSLGVGDTAPLYVVDGIPYQNNPNIPPSQIKSIDILKDGASAAVYGVRASNGVILITTKTGDRDKLRVDITSWAGVQNITSGTELMNTNDQFYFDQIRTAGLGIESTVLAVNPRALENDTDFVSAIQNDNAVIQNYEVNVSGGRGDVTVNANVNYFDQDGVLINSGFDRLTTRLTGQVNKEKFKMYASIGVTNEGRQREPWALYENAIRQMPWSTPIQDLPTNGDIIQIPDQNEITYSYLSGILENTDDQQTTRYNVAFNASYEFFKGLKYQVRLGNSSLNSKRIQFQPKYLIYDAKGNYNPTASRPQARLNEDYRNMSNNVLENVLSYDKEFGKHNLGVTGVLSYEEYKDAVVGIGVTHAENGNNDIQTLGAAVSTSNPTSYNFNTTMVGMMLRAQYSYDSRYMISASIRRDGTSRFNEQNRWDYFPGVSVGWNVSEESFWSVKAINGLKLRASYAGVGNNRTSNTYVANPTVNGGVNYLYGSSKTLTPGLIQRSLTNPDIHWETQLSSNIGLDLAMFENKVQFTADVYQNEKKDMILARQLPPSSGTNVTGAADAYNSVTVNAGSMVNRGIELALSYRDVTNFGLRYNFTGTFTKNVNEVTNLDGIQRGYGSGRPVLTNNWADDITFLAEGYQAGGFWLVKTDGIIKTAEQLEAYQKIDANARMGDVIYRDQLTIDSNGDGIMDLGDSVINDSDRVFMGSGQPKFEMGLSLNLEYKGFDFFIQGYYSNGAKIYNGSRLYAYSEGRHVEQMGMWSPQNPEAEIPTYRTRQHQNVRAYSDLFLEDGTYFRIRTLTLGYNFQMLEKYGIGKARVYMSSVNPFTFTKYKGYDPEVGGDGLFFRGVDRGNYPVARQFLVGVQLSF
ncbi:TonB-dependent receptor [Reichenbachiella sp. MSK19-1]|uniref:SusC/RagA family TonB-linked outer membrane protein n=1 Tax=Reichenbachiella sp. MSK19-1 TaxID=1897631 RepID=UPI000E6C7021|nr:TonB-dependent receptor [Reichenbachiella sp. MSK19-1]RJE72419.1 SusC/RagA family TonB-linked outer membrane protein [Reichenbachiella sp. MSK19-1]